MITETDVRFQASRWVGTAVRMFSRHNSELTCSLEDRVLTLSGILADLGVETVEGYTDEVVLVNEGTMDISFKIPAWAAAILELLILQNKTLDFEIDDQNMLTLSGTLYDFKSYQDDGDMKSINDFLAGRE